MRTIITIDGIDGSGKSTMARSLRVALDAAGHHCLHVSIDDFRCAVDWSSAPEVDVYYNSYYDLAAARTTLAAIAGGATQTTIPVFDLVTERPTGTRTVSLAGVDVAIVEGVFSLRIPEAAAGMVVHLDTTEPEARRRIIERDLRKGRTREEIERRIDQRYFPSQVRYRSAFGPRQHAHVIVDNEEPTSPRTIKRDLSRLPDAIRTIVDRVLPPLVEPRVAAARL